MAVPDAEPAHAMTVKLGELLHQASEVKKQTTIDPPLQVSEISANEGPLLGPVVGDKDAHMTVIEKAAKNIFYAIVASTQIDEPSFVHIWNLLDILQHCGDHGQCSPQLVMLLIEELLDSQSIDGCRVVFNFLESRREVLIANNSSNKNLVILRLCNELLRRLSRAEDAVFCGRVYIFLFQSFPLGDKSSVNLRGVFHVENETTFDDYLKPSNQEGDGMQVDTGRTDESAKQESKSEEGTIKSTESEQTVEKKAKTLDTDTLYPIFWSLQNSFSNPIRLFEQKNFKEFQKGLEATLAKFKEVPKVIQAGDSDGKRTLKRKLDEDYDEFASTFNPKYLTSRDLFELELSDLAFQRHILVQALILIDFLFSLTEKSKKKPYYVNAQKALQYSFTLPEQDAEWALGIKNLIANYLQDGPDGKFYYRMVDTVLSRDKNWVTWKMENCQPFTRNRVPIKDFLDAKSGAQTACARKTIAKSDSSSSNLEFLSNTDSEKGLERLKQADRHAVPSGESYVRDVQTMELDLDMVTSEQEKREMGENKASNTWRALRIASKDKLSLFERLDGQDAQRQFTAQLDSKVLERLFQPEPAIEATGEDNAPTAPEGRDAVPQEQHQSAEEQRAGQRSQVTADTAAE
ncbi:nuclear matrix protein [Zopfia rhizophila CBS 207.26]|uniref:Nuclear matrix protein n=1 Tax=Zopfia rhizophila CBS 207.26 TaxID=1314779 RepID=A0A6A6DKB8_9PEZI|nr:nuclear matrix protein [Zopfia rhizophila CBS 207.26]